MALQLYKSLNHAKRAEPLSHSHLTPATQFLASNLHSGEEFCCQKVNIHAFEQLLQQKHFQLKKGWQRLLDTLPKPGNHHFAQLGCHSTLKRELQDQDFLQIRPVSTSCPFRDHI
jgi:hypothetical protein